MAIEQHKFGCISERNLSSINFLDHAQISVRREWSNMHKTTTYRLFQCILFCKEMWALVCSHLCIKHSKTRFSPIAFWFWIFSFYFNFIINLQFCLPMKYSSFLQNFRSSKLLNYLQNTNLARIYLRMVTYFFITVHFLLAIA